MQIVCRGCGATATVPGRRWQFCGEECYREWRRGARGRLTPKLAARAKVLHAAGMSGRAIATGMAVDERTIRRIMNGTHWTQR
jgi:hypothetical protein